MKRLLTLAIAVTALQGISARADSPTLTMYSMGKSPIATPVTLSAVVGEPVPVFGLKSLPAGFRYAGGKVHAERDFPTANSPNKVLGEIPGLKALIQQSPAQAAGQLTEFVKKQGGNALVLDETRAFVLAISIEAVVFPKADEAWPRHDQKFAAEHYVPAETVAFALEAPTAVQLKLKRRECVAIAVALEPSASYAAPTGNWLLTTTLDAPAGAPRTLVQGAWSGSATSRSFSAVAACAGKPVLLPLSLASTKGGAVGTGPAKLRVYRYAVPDYLIAAECARCSGALRRQAAWSKSDLNKCLPPPLTHELCD